MSPSRKPLRGTRPHAGHGKFLFRQIHFSLLDHIPRQGKKKQKGSTSVTYACPEMFIQKSSGKPFVSIKDDERELGIMSETHYAIFKT
jgi:hypothetical protein